MKNLTIKKITFLILSLCTFLSNYSQAWQNNLPAQKVANGTVDFYDYQNAFYQEYPSDVVDDGYKTINNQRVKIPYWKIFKRWEWFNESRIDKQSGAFPSKGPSQVLLEYNQQNFQSRSPINGGGNWTSSGPTTNNSGYSGTGRLNCVTFHPSDINTFWVGAPAGGLWKTTNGGANWAVLTDDNDVLGVSTIALHPNYTTNQTLFIGTGDRDGGSIWTLGGGQSNDNNGIGILKSTDDGNTWAATGLSFTTDQKVIINEILIDPNNASIMIAATSQGIYKSSDAGVNWVLNTIDNFNYIDLDFKPGDFSTIYASTKEYWNDSKIYKSTDSGDNWSEVLSVTAGFRIQLAVSANNPSIVYALAANNSSGLKGIYKSTNSGNSFSVVYAGSDDDSLINNVNHGLLNYFCDGSGSNEGQGSYDLCLAADPNNANVIFLGGVNTWKSSDGGISWNNSNMWNSSSYHNSCGSPEVHADKHYLIFQNGSSTLFECNDGGIYKTTNSGATWTDLTGDLSISQLYRIGASSITKNEVIAGLQDNGTKLFSSNNWSDVKGGDGMECLIDFTDDNVQYGTYVNGQLDITTDHWVNQISISDNIPGGENGAWVSPYVIDPVNNQTIYIGYEEVWKTVDRGNNWTEISNLNISGKIRSMAISESNNQFLYIANQDTIWKTTNGGNSWTDITGNLPTGTNYITYIAIKNNDPNTVWVTFGNYNSDKVYQTIDGGVSWTDISTGLPPIPTMTIVQNKDNTVENELYVGTDIGVYQKIGTNNWTPFCSGLPNVVVAELEIYYNPINSDSNKLWAGTFGRGLWSSNLPSSSTVSNPANFVTSTVSDSQIDLTWNLNSSGDDVLLAASSSSSFGAPIDGNSYSLGDLLPGGGQVIASGNINSFSDTGLFANTTYYYKIWANDGNDYSSGLNNNATTFSAASCDYTINMIDSFGDGWNGASIDISINGSFFVSVTNVSTTAANAIQTYTFSSFNGDSVSFSFTSGLYDNEISFEIFDPTSNSLTSGIVAAPLNSGVFLTDASSPSSCLPPPNYTVYFELHTAYFTANGGSISPDGIYIGGGFIGGHDALLLNDSDGDGIWHGSISLPSTGGYFTILNGNCPNYSCQENLIGQCFDSNYFNNRNHLLGGFSQDTLLVLEAGSCSTPISCAPPVPITTDNLICNPGDSTYVSANHNGYVYWYDAPLGGNLVEKGWEDTLFVSPLITTSYFAEVANFDEFYEDFESYNSGDYIVASDPNNWAVWPGGGAAVDMPISDVQGNPGNSLRVFNSDGTDVVLEFGEAFSTGIFYYSMDMYIVGEGYINFQEDVNIGTTWNMSVTFIGGVINVDIDGASVLTGSYTATNPAGNPVWNTFKFECDYSTGTWEVFTNGVSQGTFVNADPVASVNIYPGAGVEYYADNIEWTVVSESCRSFPRSEAIVDVGTTTTTTDVLTSCDSLTWINGITYYSSVASTEIDTLQNISGCDSIVILDLTINNSSTITIPITACDTFTWDGGTYDSTGFYTKNYSSANSCDSTVTLDLIINKSSTTTIPITACDTFTWDGVTYDSTGFYTKNYSSANSCDSTVTLDLIINKSSTITIPITACDTFTWDGVTYDSTGFYTKNYSSANSCDSSVTLDLTINKILTNFTASSTLFTTTPFSVQFTNSTLNLSNFSFTWDFGDNTVIQSNNSSVFHQYMYNGLYDVSLIAEDITNGCGYDTLKKDGLIFCSGGPGVSIIEVSNQINIFPNPTNENVTISIENFNGNIQTEVYDLIGHRLQVSNETTISLRDYARGIYLLKVTYGDIVEEVKVIKD